MIKIESIHISELRGIRDLALSPAQQSLVIVGPNGSGKSGVVDAIQFALTGEIARLTGFGTGDLSLGEHGPHVLKKDYPDAAFVELKVFIPQLGKSASVSRRIKKPQQVVIAPNDADIVAVLAQVAAHPELTLSRREIIKFILTDPSKRSRDVQTLLKLEEIDATRAALRTTENRLTGQASAAQGQLKIATQSFLRHVDLPELRDDDVLAAVNAKRTLLGTSALSDLHPTSAFAEGLPLAEQTRAVQDKSSASRDVDALIDLARVGPEARSPDAMATLLHGVARLDSEPLLLAGIKIRPFVESGLELIDGPSCPLCEKGWDIEELRLHLRNRLDALREAEQFKSALLSAASDVGRSVAMVEGLVRGVAKLPEAAADSKMLSEWAGRLSALAGQLKSVEGVVSSAPTLKGGWADPPEDVEEVLRAIQSAVMARPDTTDLVKARDFLVLAQERWKTLALAKRDAEEKAASAERGRVVYKSYCDAAEEALNQLYHDVEDDFANFYRLLNPDDESKFVAKLEPADGKLGLMVDFHEKGMFPPGAYHSEGHQDGMGVCLYLALMRRVLGAQFTVAVLDDVVMSVDTQHRKQFCRLLKTEFPDTQFLITTHDPVWARQMRTEGVVSSKGIVEFFGWSVETGPVVEEGKEVWTRIDEDLAKNDVPGAAARLRRHIELVASDLADKLGAEVPYKADAAYDKGELMGAVLGRQRDLLGRAAKAAGSWNNAGDTQRVRDLQTERAKIMDACNGEDWVINKAVHYNELYNLSREDFRPVVSAFRQLFELFRCSNCGTTAVPTPRAKPVTLRCDCGSFQLNLKSK